MFFLKNSFFTLIFLLLVKISTGQEYITVTGTVLDKETRQPLHFASICIAGNRIGTVSNYSGNFLLKIPSHLKEDTLHFSFIGFSPKKVPLNRIRNNMIEVFLEPIYYNVKEVVIRALNPTEIIKTAISKIPENYPTKPVNFTAFYREAIRENENFIQYIEAVLGVYKTSYISKKKDNLEIIKGRHKEDVYHSMIWDYIRFVDGPYEMIRSDIAKYPKNFITVSQSRINFLDQKYFKHYDYTLLENRRIEESDQYVIAFKPKVKSKRAMYEGFICIDKKTYAFTSMDYTFCASRLKRAKIISSITEYDLLQSGVTIKAIDFFNIVKFKQYQGKWYVSNSKMEYHFVFWEEEKKYLSHISNVVDFVVTDINNTNVQPIKTKNYIKVRKSLTGQLGEFDEEFWENYNFILENQF